MISIRALRTQIKGLKICSVNLTVHAIERMHQRFEEEDIPALVETIQYAKEQARRGFEDNIVCPTTGITIVTATLDNGTTRVQTWYRKGEK